MFKKIFGVLDSALQAFSSAPPLLRQAMCGIEEVDAALAGRCVAFVASGKGPEVLLALRAHTRDLGKLMGQPGRLKWRPAHDDELRAMAEKSMAARHVLYQRATNDEASVAMLVRLGKLLEAADGTRSLDRTGAGMPDWLNYLLNDATWAACPEKETRLAASPNPERIQQASRPAWDVDLVAALLAHDGFHQAMLLPVLFERRALDGYDQNRVYQRLLAPGVLDDYLLAHPQDVAAAAGVLSASGRLLLVNRLGANPALLAAFGTLILKLASGDSSTVRAAAARHIGTLDPAASVSALGELLGAGTTIERTNAALLLARIQGDGAVDALDAALAAEASKPVQQTIRSALAHLRTTATAGDIALPEPPPLPPAPTEVLGDDAVDLLLANHAELLVRLRKNAEQEEASNRASKHKATWQQQHYKHCEAFSDSELRLAVTVLNGGAARRGAVFKHYAFQQILLLNGRLEARPDFGLMQVLRFIQASGAAGRSTWFHPQFLAWLRRQDQDRVDLRQLAALAEACGGEPDGIALAGLRSSWTAANLPQTMLPPARVWPLYASRPDLIDEGLGLAPTERNYYTQLDLGRTLSVLATFPSIPARWMPRVLELALGEGKTHRASAQQVLAHVPDIGNRVCAALASSKQELRIEAARWLARLANQEAVPALHAALNKETRETVSAALITALEQLGEDMSAHLAPAKLLAQAQKGLKARPPSGMAWLDLDALPACTWAGGGAVEPALVRWWVILACKLKEPGGNPLLERYLGLLDAASRAALGRWVLHAFIARDTAHPSLDDGIAWAQAHAAARYQQYQQSFQKWPQYYEAQGKLTPEQVFEQVKREKMADYLGSAIGEKGLLALAWTTPGAELVGAIQSYMRDHYQRRAQVEALVEAASVSDQPAVIQFILSIARRYRTASVQEKARVLVQRIAERNGWTADQLADRTVPTAGLDETGRLLLQYGSRQYTVTLDAAMKPVLKNEDGKVVAALPAARQDDPPESVKEAKQQLSGCKKELKQVIDMQTARLYEAMCAGRAWPVAEWREFLLAHPVAGRLAQRLVWRDGERAFRPSDDGTLLDIDDEEVTIADGATIRLAHGSLLAADQAAAWVQHCKDYKVTPLFAQMTRPLAAVPKGAAIADRVGWISDTFKLRSAFNKLGYQRGTAEDGGVFYEYTKPFASAGLTVTIEFSGSMLPEENLPAALKTLSFRYIDGARQGYGDVALGQVPAILLAEAWADYHAVAATCAGFDIDWEKKMPW